MEFYALASGDRIPRFVFRVGAAERDAYLDATGESRERWPEYVPPLALGALALGGLLEAVPLPDGAVHTGQEFAFLAVVPLGAEVTADVELVQRSERRGSIVTAFALDLRVGEAPVATGRATVIAPAPEVQ